MTPDQMTELAARLRDVAKWDRVMSHNPQRAADCDAAADIIESMAQREPLSGEQIVEAFFADSNENPADFAAGVRFAEQAHGIRSKK